MSEASSHAEEARAGHSLPPLESPAVLVALLLCLLVAAAYLFAAVTGGTEVSANNVATTIEVNGADAAAEPAVDPYPLENTIAGNAGEPDVTGNFAE